MASFRGVPAADFLRAADDGQGAEPIVEIHKVM